MATPCRQPWRRAWCAFCAPKSEGQMRNLGFSPWCLWLVSTARAKRQRSGSSRHYTLRGHKVLIAAADTFRAAAIDQLRIWADRAGVPVVAHQPGADPGAVVYDAIRACRARGHDLLLVDTAGRLHTRYNLMAELRKVAEVARRNVHRAPHEVFLVLDATTGQNGMAQARSFREAVGLTGVILAKLDGTAKGGVAFSIARELGVPVRFVGTGEGLEDLVEFDPAAYVAGLFERR